MPRLRVPQFAVTPVCIHEQRFVIAALDQFAALKHRDVVAEAAGRETVRDEHRGFAPDRLVERGVYFLFR